MRQHCFQGPARLRLSICLALDRNCRVPGAVCPGHRPLSSAVHRTAAPERKVVCLRHDCGNRLVCHAEPGKEQDSANEQKDDRRDEQVTASDPPIDSRLTCSSIPLATASAILPLSCSIPISTRTAAASTAFSAARGAWTGSRSGWPSTRGQARGPSPPLSLPCAACCLPQMFSCCSLPDSKPRKSLPGGAAAGRPGPRRDPEYKPG